jgi:hypothetical protein
MQNTLAENKSPIVDIVAAAGIPTAQRNERVDEKKFRIPVSNGIFAHHNKLKGAIWLLIWYIDKTTKEVLSVDGTRNGIVLGGKPIADEDPASALGCYVKTIGRYRQRLARLGFIGQKRTPVGYVIQVRRSEKWPPRGDSGSPKSGDQAGGDVAKVGIRSSESGDQKFQKWGSRSDKAVQGKDKAVEEEAAAAPAATEKVLEPEKPLQEKSDFQSREKIKGTEKEQAGGVVEILSRAAAFSEAALKATEKPCWKEISCTPVGSLVFRCVWKKIYADTPEGGSLEDAMERCIMFCQEQNPKIPVPPPFYEAKQKLDRVGNGHDRPGGLTTAEPNFTDPLPPRGVRPENDI